MTTFIFVRHGQSETNIHNQFAGQFDTELTQTGVLQAKLLSDWVADNYKIDHIYASNLSRAYHTALETAKKAGIPVIKDAQLREINGGFWHGKKYTDIAEEFPDAYRVWKNNIGEAVLPQGESMREFATRITQEIKRIASIHPDQTVMVVTHAVAIRAIMAVFGMGDISKAQEISWVPNASVTVAKYENGALQFEIVGFDDYLENMKSNLPPDIV